MNNKGYVPLAAFLSMAAVIFMGTIAFPWASRRHEAQVREHIAMGDGEYKPKPHYNIPDSAWYIKKGNGGNGFQRDKEKPQVVLPEVEHEK